MDAFVVHGTDLEPLDPGVRLELGRRVADDIFHENWVVVGLHGDVALVCALEKRVDRGGGGFFGDLDEFLDPEEVPFPVRFFPGAGGDGDIAALVVRSVVAYFLAAGAEGPDRHAHAEEEVVLGAIGFSDEGADVVHGRGESRNGGLALDEVGKLDLDVRGFGIEALFEFVEDGGHRVHGELALMLGENLQEATHVGSLEMVRQADGEGYLRGALLLLVLPIEDCDGIKQITDTDLVDRDATGVGSALDVFHFSYSAHDELVSQTLTRTRRTVSRSV